MYEIELNKNTQVTYKYKLNNLYFRTVFELHSTTCENTTIVGRYCISKVNGDMLGQGDQDVRNADYNVDQQRHHDAKCYITS